RWGQRDRRYRRFGNAAAQSDRDGTAISQRRHDHLANADPDAHPNADTNPGDTAYRRQFRHRPARRSVDPYAVCRADLAERQHLDDRQLQADLWRSRHLRQDQRLRNRRHGHHPGRPAQLHLAAGHANRRDVQRPVPHHRYGQRHLVSRPLGGRRSRAGDAGDLHPRSRRSRLGAPPAPPRARDRLTAMRRLGQAFGHGRLLALVVLAAALALRLFDPPPVELMRLRGFDVLQTLFPRQAGDHPVAIVDVDDESLAALGQWPWPRTRLAALVDRLTALGAAVIGFDVYFPEPDRMSPALAAQSFVGLDEPTRTALALLPSND